jgi:hypothetical protein
MKKKYYNNISHQLLRTKTIKNNIHITDDFSIRR